MSSTITRPYNPRSREELVQPPPKFEGLTGEALYRALTRDDETWNSERFALESGRSLGRFRVWVSERYSVDRGEMRETDRTAPRPDPTRSLGRFPGWRAGAARAWMMQVGLMTREGKSIPHKPAGRARNVADVIPRQRRADASLREQAPRLAARYRELVDAGSTRAQAKETLRQEYHLDTIKQVDRRLEMASRIARNAEGGAVRKQTERIALAARRHAELTGQGKSEVEARQVIAVMMGISDRSVKRLLARAASLPAPAGTPNAEVTPG